MSDALNKDYQICDKLGRGRFGTIYRCFLPETGDFYACKSIDKHLLSYPLNTECLEKEAKIMHLVAENPNVVEIHAAYEDDISLHMILELCPELDLYDRISKRTFSEPEAAAVMLPLMEAIAHCHHRGVEHRDVKPDNVLFDSWNGPKLADFGSADCFREGGRRTMRGIVGTPYYVAPEVISGRDYNEKIDVWSTGVILYIMLTGMSGWYDNTKC